MCQGVSGALPLVGRIWSSVPSVRDARLQGGACRGRCFRGKRELLKGGVCISPD